MTGIARIPTSPEQVRIYRVAPKNYEEIALVSASAGHDFRDNSSLIESAVERLKEEAAKVGANGVLLSEIDERDASITAIHQENVNAYSNWGDRAHAHGNSMSRIRGDTYTRVRGLAIFVSQ